MNLSQIYLYYKVNSQIGVIMIFQCDQVGRAVLYSVSKMSLYIECVVYFAKQYNLETSIVPNSSETPVKAYHNQSVGQSQH